MDVLLPLFSNTGLSGAVLASLLGIIYVLLRDRRIEHTEWAEMQKETNKILMELSGLIREFQGMSRH
jgi:multidrug resistance efflux pump